MYIYASGDGLDRITEDSGTDDTIYFSSELMATICAFRGSPAPTTCSSISAIWPPASSSPTNGLGRGAAIEHVHFVGETGLEPATSLALYLASLATSGADTITGSWAGEQIRRRRRQRHLPGWTETTT